MLRSLLPSLALLLFGSPARTQPPPESLHIFHLYTNAVEARLTDRHRSPGTFLPASPAPGQDMLEQLTPAAQPPGALLHHWRATRFLPGAHLADMEQLLRNLDQYPRLFAPDVVAARVLESTPDHLTATLRVRQKHVLTVVLDTTYSISLGRLDSSHGFSSSRSTRIQEIGPAGNALPPGEEHGFLWAQNTWWTYEERDGGLLVQVESVSLSRSIPTGLGWAVRPFVESVPRDSLRFTLDRTAQALRR